MSTKLSIDFDLSALQLSEDARHEQLAIEHQASRPHHQLVVEAETRCGMPCQQFRCECGWRGEWVHERLAEEAL